MERMIGEFLDTVLFFCVFYCFFKERCQWRRKRFLILGLLICCGIFIGINRDLEDAYIRIGIIWCMFIPILFFKEKWAYKIVAFVLCYSGARGVVQISLCCLAIMCQIHLSSIMYVFQWELVGKCIALILMVSLCIFRRRKEIIPVSLWNSVIIAVAYTVVAIMLGYLGQSSATVRWGLAFKYSTLVICTLMIGVSFTLIIIDSSRKKHRRESQNQAQYIKQQQLYMEEIRKGNSETRKMIHDFKAHLNTMSILEQQKKYEELKQYMRETGEEFTRISKIVPDLGNDIINAILLQKIQEAGSQGIRIIYEGKINNKLVISSLDLCAVVHNLLSNAIEYCKSRKFEEITFQIGGFRNNVMIQVTNPTDEEITWDKIYRNTAKSDGKHHGLGLQNVSDVVKKYNGSIDLICDKGQVLIKVLLMPR